MIRSVFPLVAFALLLFSGQALADIHTKTLPGMYVNKSAAASAAQSVCVSEMGDTYQTGQCSASGGVSTNPDGTYSVQISGRCSNGQGSCSFYGDTWIVYAAFYLSSCPAGESADATGLCGASPDQCHAGDTFDQFIDLGPGQSLPNRLVIDGCVWELSGGALNTCLVGAKSDGSPGQSCSVTFTSTGEQSDGDTGKPPPSQVSDSGSGSYHAPTKNHSSDPPPVESDNADGSTQTTKTTTHSATGGGFSVVKMDGGAATITHKDDSNYSVEDTKISTAYQDGSGSVQQTVTKTFQNGDTYVYNVSSDGSVTVTHTPGKSGSSSSTTHTDVGSDGGVTSDSSSSGSTSGSNFACDETTGRCVYVDNNADGVGTDNDSNPCNEGNGTDCNSSGDSGTGSGSGSDSGSSVEGSGTCDPTQGDCGQSDEGGQFAGSPFPSLDDQPSMGDTLTGTLGKLRDAPIYKSIAGISASVPDAGDCPFGSTHLDYLDVDIDFSSGCDLYDQNRGLLSSAAKAAWSLLGIVIILGL